MKTTWWKAAGLMMLATICNGCKRDFTCSCTVEYNGDKYYKNYVIPNASLPKARHECDNYGDVSEAQVVQYPGDYARGMCELD